MKQITNALFFMLLFAAGTYAQPPSYKYRDSISLQLVKHGISLGSFPPSDPCIRIGVAPITIGVRDSVTRGVFPNDSAAGEGHRNEPPNSGQATIYWVHGLNGNVESLAVLANATQFGNASNNFPARNVFCLRSWSNTGQTYAENFGVTFAAGDLQNMAELLPEKTGSDYIIAHSQGGIVSREWLRRMELEPQSYGNYAHGLVTFGTPHGGAMILNNTRPELGDKAPAFFKEACTSLAGAMIIPRINASFFTRLALSTHTQSLVNTACSGFSNTIVPFVLDNYHKRTTRDYYVGSEFLTGNATTQGLSQYELNVPVVQFFGEEEEPVLWRFMSSTMKLGHDALDNNEIVFGYDQDDQLIGEVNKLLGDFTAGYQYEADKLRYWSNKSCWQWFFRSPTSYAICLAEKNSTIAAKKKNMDAYQRAIVWLSNANDYYQTDLVGARAATVTAYCLKERSIVCTRRIPANTKQGYIEIKLPAQYTATTVAAGSSGCPNGAAPIRNLQPGCSGTETTTTIYKTSYYYKPNDGVVLAESARAPILVKSSNPGNTHCFVKLPRTNHDQMKNCAMTRDALTRLYRGDYGQFFKVEAR